jgi:carbon-monoxide dehydrogenase small subunit
LKKPEVNVKLKEKSIKLEVNGRIHEVDVKPHQTLLNVIRNELGLKGTKSGCESGECGTCTVILDGKTVHSCLVLAAQADGKKIITIEGIGTYEKPHPLQQSFVEAGAVQCGFCTPGMILSAKALLDNNPNPTTEEIKRAIDGNLCRCTGYINIIKAIKIAAQRMRRKEV